MQENETGNEDRRGFLLATGRYVALGGLAAYATFQFVKDRLLKNDPNCIRLHTCEQCVEFSTGCQLPKAENFREQRTGDTE